jgi:alpha,alpha-trehalose phosphorylase
LANRPVEIMKKTYAYYEPLTTHDSSLSRCIHAVQAARLGQVDKAYRYFLDTVYLDLNNVQKNTEYGLHVANLGGIYLTLLNGFLGLTIDENISIYPSLPKHIEHLKLNFRINEDTIIKAHLTHKEIKLQVNKPTTIYIYDEQVKIKEQITRKIR